MRVAFLHACMLAGAYEAIVCGGFACFFLFFFVRRRRGRGRGGSACGWIPLGWSCRFILETYLFIDGWMRDEG